MNSFVPDREELFGLLGTGIAVLVAAPTELREIVTYLHLAENGVVTIYCGKAEVGQNIRTSLAQVVAEELSLPLSAIRLVMGDTALTPFEIGTFGSRTTPIMAPQVRCAAAATRGRLIDLAAQEWQVDPALLTVSEGHVCDPVHPRQIRYGTLATCRQELLTVEQGSVATIPADRWKVVGCSALKVDGAEFVTGRHRYSVDIGREGMRYGRVLRPPAFQATLKRIDASVAEALPGVTVVQQGEFVGVVAPTLREATHALGTIVAEWHPAPQQPTEAELFDHFQSGHSREPLPETIGQTLSATYTVAYIAHAPLEPRAAVAEWNDDHLTVWTGTQRPFGVREELQVIFGLPADHIRVIVPDTGSGYGGKHTGDAAIEAARLARVAGKPVKLTWTREEEFTWAYFRPAGVIAVTATVQEDGTLTGWQFDNYNSGAAGIVCPYAVPDAMTAFHECHSPLRQGSYRALAATANHFARESHIDDLAHAVGIDPLAFRRKNLTSERLRAVLEAAATRFGWADRGVATPGRGYGLAVGTEKGSYVANCVEVAVDPGSGEVKVTRIVVAYECGAILNPLHLENQIEGAIVMGLGGALFEAIHFEGGRITNPSFATYRVPRFSDVPAIEIVLLDRKDLPSVGAGETPIVAIAPAIGNALFDATGIRHRSLPLCPQDTGAG